MSHILTLKLNQIDGTLFVSLETQQCFYTDSKEEFNPKLLFINSSGSDPFIEHNGKFICSEAFVHFLPKEKQIFLHKINGKFVYMSNGYFFNCEKKLEEKEFIIGIHFFYLKVRGLHPTIYFTASGKILDKLDTFELVESMTGELKTQEEKIKTQELDIELLQSKLDHVMAFQSYNLIIKFI